MRKVETLVGESRKPVIGIRPVIDARLGALNVRGSLEEQTMSMAQSAKALLETLRYPDGTPAKVVISDTTIGRVAEAALCREQFEREGVEITLTVTPCWCYGSETMDTDPSTVKAVWGFNGTERPGAVYLAAVLAAHAQKGLPAFGIYGHEVQDADDRTIPADVAEKILRFGRAALAAVGMRGKSYLQIGGPCMGIAGSFLDCSFFEDYLGMRVESVDEVEVLRRIKLGIYDKREYARALAWTKANCPEGLDKNPGSLRRDAKQKAHDLEFSVKCALVIRDLFKGNLALGKDAEERLGHNAIAGGFQGQRQWTDFLPNTDFAEAILNSSFDWNGAREPLILATENDTLNGASMLLCKLLTGRAAMFSDVRTYWSGESVARVTGYRLTGNAARADGFLHLINSGASALDFCGESRDEAGKPAVKPHWEMGEADVEACLRATEWCYADLGYFRGGGYSSRFVTRAEMPVTMVRINLVKGLGPVLQLAEGWTVHLPDEVTDVLWKRTDYTWPCTWFTPRITGKGKFQSAYTVMNAWGANHGAIAYGHIGADLISLCSMLRIPVCMHNVAEEDIFRPAVWNAYGSDPEGQDYRACAAFGPLYAKTK